MGSTPTSLRQSRVPRAFLRHARWSLSPLAGHKTMSKGDSMEMAVTCQGWLSGCIFNYIDVFSHCFFQPIDAAQRRVFFTAASDPLSRGGWDMLSCPLLPSQWRRLAFSHMLSQHILFHWPSATHFQRPETRTQ